MKTKFITLQDGDDLSIVVKTPPSVCDPEGLVAGVAQVYRVVANSFSPTLELVPLGVEPVKLADIPEQES